MNTTAFYSLFIKYIRKKKIFSLENLAILTDLSKGYLSEVENLHHSIKEDKFFEIVEKLDIAFPSVSNHRNLECKIILNHEIQNFICLNEDVFSELYDLSGLISELEYSFDCFYYLLMSYFNLVYVNDYTTQREKELHDFLQFGINCLEDDYQAFFYDITALRLIKEEKYHSAIDVLSIAEEKVSGSEIRHLDSLIHYHQLYSLRYLNDHFQTFLLSNYVVDELKSYGNMLRASYAMNLKGLSLIFLAQYENSKKLYENLLLYSQQLQDSSLSMVIKNNIIVNEFAAKNYEEVIKLVECNQSRLSFDLYHLSAFSYLRLHKYSECKKYIKNLNLNELRPINIKLIKAIDFFIQPNEAKFLNLISKIIDFYIKDNDAIMLHAVYDFLIEYFEESNNLKALIKVQKACLKLNNPKTDNTILNKIKLLNQ